MDPRNATQPQTDTLGSDTRCYGERALLFDCIEDIDTVNWD
jgi:hypothetical protein